MSALIAFLFYVGSLEGKVTNCISETSLLRGYVPDTSLYADVALYHIVATCFGIEYHCQANVILKTCGSNGCLVLKVCSSKLHRLIHLRSKYTTSKEVLRDMGFIAY